MIQAAHLQNLLSQMATTKGNKELNANLPMLLRILDKKGADKYLVQLGKLIIETQSSKELKIGTNYWANVKQGKDGLIISDLIKQPKMLENLGDFRLKLNSSDLKELLEQTHKSSKQLENVFKDFLLDRLPLAHTKQEFLELSNLLIALQNGVFSMVIQDEDGKDSLVQMKKQVDYLEFYSIFPNLGEISGVVSVGASGVSGGLDSGGSGVSGSGSSGFNSGVSGGRDSSSGRDSGGLDSGGASDFLGGQNGVSSHSISSIDLRIQVMSEQVKDFLLKNINDLKGFENVQIDVGQHTPLWDLSNFETSYILNLRG